MTRLAVAIKFNFGHYFSGREPMLHMLLIFCMEDTSVNVQLYSATNFILQGVVIVSTLT